MALKYNGTSPTAIKYNGTDLTVLKYGSTAVWGKPYSLSISAGTNTSVTVTRTSSPNQGASTGTLSSGSIVYYGDVLTISYSVSSGYKISTSTVNGTTFSSGASFTVTSAISVVTTAIASTSWKTVWTGTKRQQIEISDTPTSITITGFTGMVSGRPTRISGTFVWYEEWKSWTNNTLSYNNLEVGQYLCQNKYETNGTISDFTLQNSGSQYYCYWGFKSFTSSSITIQHLSVLYGEPYYSLFGGLKSGFVVTKIEQYY